MKAPASLNQYGESLKALSGRLGGLSRQMSGALASGDAAQLGSLAGQINSAVAETFGQLSAGLKSSVDSFSPQLGTMSQKVESSKPQK